MRLRPELGTDCVVALRGWGAGAHIPGQQELQATAERKTMWSEAQAGEEKHLSEGCASPTPHSRLLAGLGEASHPEPQTCLLT